MIDKVLIYTDGGARGNPGPAAIGIVIYDSLQKEMQRHKEYIGETTNNQAEYKALIKALQMALKMGAQTLVCYLDSELVVKQMQGHYRIREEGIAMLTTEALKLISKFKQVEFIHIPRAKNKLADQLVNEALDNAGY